MQINMRMRARSCLSERVSREDYLPVSFETDSRLRSLSDSNVAGIATIGKARK